MPRGAVNETICFSINPLYYAFCLVFFSVDTLKVKLCDIIFK